MSKNFGIIAEGITDIWTIQQIVEGVFNDGKEEDVATTTELQPMSSADPGSYTLVFKFLQSETFAKFLEDPHAYAIIQIDTDTLGRWSEYFSKQPELLAELQKITDRPDGSYQEKAPALVEQIKQFLILVIGKELYESKKERIIFAIAVNEIECWILTLHANRNIDRDKIVSCFKTLVENYGFPIDPNKKAIKNGQYFRPAIKDFKKRNKIEATYKTNKSLEIFIEQLLPLNI